MGVYTDGFYRKTCVILTHIFCISVCLYLSVFSGVYFLLLKSSMVWLAECLIGDCHFCSYVYPGSRGSMIESF